jgi:hypothetical protein
MVQSRTLVNNANDSNSNSGPIRQVCWCNQRPVSLVVHVVRGRRSAFAICGGNQRRNAEGFALCVTVEIMSQLSFVPGPGHVRVEGDFARVFDADDYTTMINALDEATVVLRAHLVMEEFLNIWAARVTSTEDLFEGIFVSFKTKLAICQNLGFDARFAKVLDKLNDIRNRYSHRRKYQLEESKLNSLRDAVDALPSPNPTQPCSEFEIWLEGTDISGARRQMTYTWATADVKKRMTIVQVITVLKLVQWMQDAFNSRGVKYDLIVVPAAGGLTRS